MEIQFREVVETKMICRRSGIGDKINKYMFFPQSKAETTEIWNKEDGK